jgi:pimeloyl-ACP methyl ester carboxylesterase
VHQILFIQGGGADVHDKWDNKLVDSLRAKLGSGYELSYPRMPDEDEASYMKWAPAIRHHIARSSKGLILVGHSLGGAILIQVLAEQPPERAPGAIILISAPFIGEHGWPGDQFELPQNLGAKLPRGVPVHIFHGRDDTIAPPSHSDLYARAIPQAKVHRLSGRDHQLNNDLSEVAEVVRALA